MAVPTRMSHSLRHRHRCRPSKACSMEAKHGWKEPIQRFPLHRWDELILYLSVLLNVWKKEMGRLNTWISLHPPLPTPMNSSHNPTDARSKGQRSSCKLAPKSPFVHLPIQNHHRHLKTLPPKSSILKFFEPFLQTFPQGSSLALDWFSQNLQLQSVLSMWAQLGPLTGRS